MSRARPGAQPARGGVAGRYSLGVSRAARLVAQGPRHARAMPFAGSCDVWGICFFALHSERA
jgi:hypothetical protein